MELVKVENNELKLNNNFIKEYKEYQIAKLAMEMKEKEFKQELLEKMKEVGKDKIIIDGFSAVIRKGSTRKSIDSKRLKEELPDIAEEYSKTSETKDSLVISVE